jgi:hypothetical protein
LDSKAGVQLDAYTSSNSERKAVDHFQQSHTSITEGVKRRFAEIERNYPEPEYQGPLAMLRAAVINYVNSPVPKNDDELVQLTQGHTMTMMAMNHTENTLRRQKMWDW